MKLSLGIDHNQKGLRGEQVAAILSIEMRFENQDMNLKKSHSFSRLIKESHWNSIVCITGSLQPLDKRMS